MYDGLGTLDTLHKIVTSNIYNDEDPSYSPDGKKIVYTGSTGFDSEDEGFDEEIYTINVGGGGKSQVTNTTIPLVEDPSWGRRP